MRKNRIRITESDIRKIVREAIEDVAEDDVDENAAALAEYLDVDPVDVEQSSYDEHFYIVEGGAEEWYIFDSPEDAADFIMDPRGYDAASFMEDCWSSGEEFYNWLENNPNSASYYDMEKIFPYLDEGYYEDADWEYVAQVVLEIDGPQWYLANYDGEEHELKNGAVAYRHN